MHFSWRSPPRQLPILALIMSNLKQPPTSIGTVGAVGRSLILVTRSDNWYHGVTENPYPLPNDDSEKTRLDNLQFCVRSRLGANIVAPISPHPTHIGFDWKFLRKLIVS